jgi:hypothetical protein
LPAARYELTADIGGTVAVVQQQLPSARPTAVDRPLVEAMIGLNQRMAGLLAEYPHRPAVRLYLRDSGPGFCRHEPLAGYDRRAAWLLGWVREVGAGCDTAAGPRRGRQVQQACC